MHILIVLQHLWISSVQDKKLKMLSWQVFQVKYLRSLLGKDFRRFCHSIFDFLSCIKMDFRIERDGNIICDSRQERLDETRKYIELTRKHIADPTLKAIMQSHHAAFNDPDNEFLHLYEIRDALINRFSSKKNALKKLKISDSEWSKLGDLANTENHPVKQSRHRGKFVGELREATMEELTEARRIAAAMIKSYLNYLEEQANAELSPQA